MKKIILILLAAIISSSCQKKEEIDLEYVISRFNQNVKNLEKVEYKVQRIDTFPDGFVWNNKGYVLIEKNPDDKLFGFSFYGKRNDVDKANLYDNGKAFEIKNHENSFKSIYHKGVLGSPGGQMVVENIFRLDSIYKNVELIEKKDNYTLKYTYEPDSVYEITDKEKIIELRKEDFFPIKITRSSNSLGNRSIYQYSLSDVKINQEVKNSVSNIKNEISNFQYITEQKQAPNPILNKTFPEINLPYLLDNTKNLLLKNGKVILLDFWEVWCSPCIKSFPQIEELRKKYKEDLLVIGIVTEDIESAIKLVEKKDITFQNLFGGQNVHESYGVNSYPRYFLIDKEGIIKEEYFGYSDEIEKDIQKLIGE